MPMQGPPALQKRLYNFWLAGLLVLLLLTGWVLIRVGPGKNEAGPRAQARSAPAAAQTMTPDRAGEKAGAAAAKEEAAAGAALPAAQIPAFDPDKDDYLLTAFSAQGLVQIFAAPDFFVLRSPGSVLNAQLILRGNTPEVIDLSATRTPADAGGNGQGAAAPGQAGQEFGISFALDAPHAGGVNQGAATGALTAAKDGPSFHSRPLMLKPYTDAGAFAPYPTVTVTAVDAAGERLAQTRAVLPVSDESGCRNCHTGPWATPGKSGISAASAGDILAVHDRRNNTDLQKLAGEGKTPDCSSCHQASEQMLSPSAAVHGFHATMALEGPEACGLCHASANGGQTRFFRDFHELYGMDCTSCHGRLADHAIALLRFSAEKGNAAAQRRMAMLSPTLAGKSEDIAPREPYVNMPHCKGCHDMAKKPDPASASAFNKWTARAEERFSRAYENTGTVRCASCHGAPHALYPAASPVGDNRDNLQPMQYQKAAAPLGASGNCAVCHKEAMDFFVHHDLPE
ncbi:cytochrome C [Desulfovibrio sp. OttesenSCG-928-A18]|nr:cytochrome C [Desulfovibrio sp. OttesenSCG-928-A18]